MLCLSGFELYSRWVPLINEMNEILKRTHFLVNFKKIEVETRLLHHNGVRFLAKFQEFTHISVAL